MLKNTLGILAIVFVMIGVSMTSSAQEAGESQVRQIEFESATLERIYQYQVYLPADYESSDKSYPVVYLLHGRGDTMSAWLNVRSTLDQMIASGELPPIIAIMPDMPSSDRGSYYVDSVYTGTLYRPEAVETAFFNDLIPHVDHVYRTIADRRSRIVGGYSMGGYGAIRYALARPDQFMGAIVLSPAVYTPLPPVDSSAREFGAFGSGTSLFDENIYTSLNYPTLLENFGSEYRLNVFIAVGDDEWKHPSPEDMEHDLDFESHRFFNRVARIPSILSEFRVYDGGHDWDVWLPGFVEGMSYLANSLNTSDDASTPNESVSIETLDGWLTGTSGDDFAGGISTDPSTGDIYQAVAVAGQLGEQSHAGGQDIAVVKYGADRSVQWMRQFGTSGDDRPYGVVVTSEQEVVVVGYTQGDFDGEHADNTSDDIIVFKVSAAGDLIWQTQIGTAEADRGYAIALAADDAVVISGYTKGNLSGENAGDKDVVTALIDSEGEIAWMYQLGGDGEDKGQAVAVGPEGVIYSAGMTTSHFTDDAAGGIDAFVLKLTPEGEAENLLQLGTTEWDEITGAVIDTQGQLVVTGFTGAELAGDFAGDKDIFMMVFDTDLKQIAADQIGSNLNDKGASVTVSGNGYIFVTGYSDGEIVANNGGFDVVLAQYDANYNLTETWQMGTSERDGTDEWAEKNLYITSYNDELLISGLTLGNVGTSTIIGGNDIFIIYPDI